MTNKYNAKGVYACKDCLVVTDKPGRKKADRQHRCGGDIVFFDSTAEFKRWSYLTLLEDMGEISHLEFHPKFPITINGRHVRTICLDSSYFEGNNAVAEDVKGYLKGATADAWDLKKTLIEAVYSKNVRVVRNGVVVE